VKPLRFRLILLAIFMGCVAFPYVSFGRRGSAARSVVLLGCEVRIGLS